MISALVNGKALWRLFDRLLRADLTDALRAQLLGAGVDLGAEPPAQVSVETWARALELAAGEIFPQAPRGESMQLLGARAGRGLKQTLKTPIALMLKVMGPRNALEKLAQLAAQHAPVLEISLAELSKNSARVTLRDLGVTEFVAGMLEAAMELVGAKNPRVVINERGVEISWQ